MKKIYLFLSIMIQITLVQAQNAEFGMHSQFDQSTYYLATQTPYYIPFNVVRNTVDTNLNIAASIKYSYQVTNGPIQKQQANVSFQTSNCVYPAGLSIYRAQLTTPVNFPTPGNYDLKIWIDSVNGFMDPNQANDTMIRHYKVLNNLQPKKGLLEYYYHMTCAPCGEFGTPFIDEMISKYNDISVTVKLHHSFSSGSPTDEYNCPDSKFLDSAMFAFAGHPSCTFNRNARHPYTNPSNTSIDFYPHVDQCPTDSAFLFRDVNFYNKVPSNLGIHNFVMDTLTHIVSFDADVQFLDAYHFNRAARLSCMLVEDSLFNYQSDGGLPAPDSMYHRYGLRKIYGAPLGKLNSVPNSVTTNQLVTLSVTDTLPAKYNKKQLYLIPILQYAPNTSPFEAEILNASRFKLSDVNVPLSFEEVVKAGHGFVSFPNPSQQKITIQSTHVLQNCSYTLFSIEGKLLDSKQIVSGNSFDVDISSLVSGIYFINIHDEHKSTRLKFFKE